MKITRPAKEEYPEYYDRYISKVTGDPIDQLIDGERKLLKLISKLSKKQLNFRYAEGKWSIKEILVHLMDGERVFAYRALTFARKDITALPGFEENEWAPNSGASERKIKSIIDEYQAVRSATIEMFANFTEEMLNSSGTANEKPMSVRSILFMIPGHELHHMGVIKERYLSK